jgi:NitT/TauT family transport system substrate-binding protein
MAAGALVAACDRRARPLTVGLHFWPANDLYFLAEHLGYYEGEPLRIADYSSAEQGLQAFRNHVADLYPCTLDEALLLASAVPDARIVQVLDDSYGADAILAQPSITSVAGLRGLKVGYEASALGAYVLSRGLELAGLTPADVVLVYMPIDEHERAFRERRVDAVVTYEPIRSRLLAAGARSLFDSRQIPGEIVDVLVTRAATLDREEAAVKALVRGWFRAADVLRSQPDAASDALSPRMHLPPEQVLDTFSGIRLASLAENRRLLQGAPPPLAKTARRLLDIMSSNRLLEVAPDLSVLFDARIVTRVSVPAGG